MADDNNNNAMKTFEDKTKKLEEKLNLEADLWGKRIAECTKGIRGDVKDLSEIESNIISYKHMAEDNIRRYLLLIHKESVNIKTLTKTRFEYYSTNYQISLKNSTDKYRLIESDLAKIQYKTDLLETHISFLRDMSSNFKTLSYSVKNKIELLNILGNS